VDQNPRSISPFPFAGRVAHIVRAKPGLQVLNELARNIWSVYLKGKPLDEEGSRAFLDVCEAIDIVRIKTTGVNASNRISTSLTTAIAWLYCAEAKPSFHDIVLMEKFRDNLKAFDNLGYVKMEILCGVATRVEQLGFVVEQTGYRLPLPQWTIDSLARFGETLDGDIQMFYDAMLFLRKYGVKASYFSNLLSVPIRSSQSWVVWDTMDFRENGSYPLL
jgi:hypothetical protein